MSPPKTTATRISSSPSSQLITRDSYGFQTTTKLRMILSVALVDAMIKDSDIVAVSPAPL